MTLDSIVAEAFSSPKTLTQQRRAVANAWTRGRIAELLAECGGNWSAVARKAGMHRTNLRRLARQVGAL